MKNILQSSILPLLALFAGLTQAGAADHTWTGLGADKNWSTIANWSGNFPPSAAESAPVRIIFPAGVAQVTSLCNITGLTIDSIYFNGSNYQVSYQGTAAPIKLSGAGLYSAGTNNICSVPMILQLPNMNFGISPNADLRLFGQLSGPGGIQKSGKGDLYLEGTSDNSFVSPLTVVGGQLHLKKSAGHIAISNTLIIGDTNGSTASGGGPDSTVIMDADQQVSFGTSLTVNPDGFLNMAGHSLAVGALTMFGNAKIDDFTGTKGTLTLLGNVSVPDQATNSFNPQLNCNVSLGGATRTFNVAESYFSIGGHISNGGASAGVIKTGPGNMTFYYSNTYTGDTIVNEGTLTVNSATDTSNFIVHPPARLSGFGTMGTVNVQDTVFNPRVYDPGNSPTIQHTTTKDLTLTSGSTFSITLDDDLAVPTPFVSVNGTVNLNGCQFSAELEVDEDFDPRLNTSFILVYNDGSDPVVGTFAGIPEGGTVRFGGRLWQITYAGNGTKFSIGNDVVLKMLSLQLDFTTDSIEMHESPDYILIRGTGEPDVDYRMQSSPDLVTWKEIGYATNTNGSLSYHATWDHSQPKYFYRFVRPVDPQ